VPPVAEFFRQFDGARIPGGCDHCDAYQTVTSPAYGHSAITMLTTHHDDWCPFLAEYEGRAP
jgi:hypothetical protein